MKYYTSLMTELAKQKIWVISENGYHYSEPLHIYWNEKQAKDCWENYKKYNESNTRTQYDCRYTLEQYNLSDIFEEEINYKIENAIWERQKEIEVQGMERLNRQIEYSSKCKSKELISDIIKYLQNLKTEM